MKNSDYVSILEDVGIPRAEADACMKWALGEGWRSCDTGLTPLVWNEKHSALFFLSAKDTPRLNLKRIGVAYRAFVKEEYMNPAALHDLHASEKKFRAIIIKSFALEGVRDPEEMMDIISWGLNYDKDLLRCHTYDLWPDAFAKSAGIDVNFNTPIGKCIRLLTRKWQSKKKFKIVRHNLGIN